MTIVKFDQVTKIGEHGVDKVSLELRKEILGRAQRRRQSTPLT